MSLSSTHRKRSTPVYVGRFAPSPTGPLHDGSLATAMASWLDARVHGGRWIVRIEDLDPPREVAGAAAEIVAMLDAFGFRWDGPIVRQSARSALYQRAFDALAAADLVYPCSCSRREIETAASAPGQATTAGVYPGTCSGGLAADRPLTAWRMRTTSGETTFVDRAFGEVRQDLAREVGDFVVRRADGLWAYQLAVVVDDAAQGVTDVVRGVDLLDSTPRQRLIQAALDLSHVRTMHLPLVRDARGRKLSKADGAAPIDRDDPLPALYTAAAHLGLAVDATEDLATFWERATAAWAARWRMPD